MTLAVAVTGLFSLIPSFVACFYYNIFAVIMLVVMAVLTAFSSILFVAITRVKAPHHSADL